MSKTGPMKEADAYAESADYLIKGSIDKTLLFGPVVQHALSKGRWYFTVAGCGRNGFRIDSLEAEDQMDTIAYRAGVMAAMIELRPCVMHDFDDELVMARFAEAVWPGEKITRIRKSIEAERGCDVA